MITEAHIDFISGILRKHLCPSTHKAFIFGSRASGNSARFSDFDIGIDGPRLSAEEYFNIKGDFEDSSFPYIVDLVQLCDVSEEFIGGIKGNLIDIPLGDVKDGN